MKPEAQAPLKFKLQNQDEMPLTAAPNFEVKLKTSDLMVHHCILVTFSRNGK